MTWTGGRYLRSTERGSQSFHAAVLNGSFIAFEWLKQPALGKHGADIMFLAERPEKEQVWALLRSGRLIDIDTARIALETGLDSVETVVGSGDGNRLFVRQRAGHERTLCLVKGRDIHSKLQNLNVTVCPPQWTLRVHFSHIAAHPSGRIWLRAAKGYWAAILLKPASHTFALEPQTTTPQLESWIPFGEAQACAEHGCKLSLAELRGGGRAWLDSRSMLHLQSRDTAIPDITIVLAESTSVPVWTSDDLIVGPQYFIGKREIRPGDPEKMDMHLRAFTASCQ
jgi:hypothetical protein